MIYSQSVRRLRGIIRSAVDHRPLAPGFKSQFGYLCKWFQLSLCLICFWVRSEFLVHHVFKSVLKTVTQNGSPPKKRKYVDIGELKTRELRDSFNTIINKTSKSASSPVRRRINLYLQIQGFQNSPASTTERWSRNTLRVVTARVFYVLRGFLASPFILNNSVQTAAPFNVVNHPRCCEPIN